MKMITVALGGFLLVFDGASAAIPTKYRMPFQIDDLSKFIDPSLWRFDCGPPNLSEGNCLYSLSDEFEITANSFSTGLEAHQIIVRWLKPRKENAASNDYFIKICEKINIALFGRNSIPGFPLMGEYKKEINSSSDKFNLWFGYYREIARCEAAVRE